MSRGQDIAANYYNRYDGDQIRQLVLPAAGAVTLTDGGAVTYGAFVDVALAATVLVDTLVVGISFSNMSATDEFVVDIGSCEAGGVIYANAAAVNGGGAGVIAAAHRQEVPTGYHQVTAAGVSNNPTVVLYSPVFIPAGCGILGRCWSVGGGNKTIDVHVMCLQNFK